LARTNRLEGREFNGPPEVDRRDDPQWMAEQLLPRAKSITNAFASIAARSTIETLRVGRGAASSCVVHLTWISAGLRERGSVK